MLTARVESPDRLPYDWSMHPTARHDLGLKAVRVLPDPLGITRQTRATLPVAGRITFMTPSWIVFKVAVEILNRHATHSFT